MGSRPSSFGASSRTLHHNLEDEVHHQLLREAAQMNWSLLPIRKRHPATALKSPDPEIMVWGLNINQYSGELPAWKIQIQDHPGEF
jgi:hypothetical protein